MGCVISDIVSEVGDAALLLVACDVDGTLAELRAAPEQAAVHAGALAALERLSRTRQTAIAVVTGRGRGEAVRLLGPGFAGEVVGSHGAENAAEEREELTVAQRDALGVVAGRLAKIAQGHEGCRVEIKPRAVALHYRGASDVVAGQAVARAMEAGEGVEGVQRRLGSMVLEYAVDVVSKGDAVQSLRRRVGATAVLFVGDDLTDEHGFAALGSGDAAVKVGQGDTRARFRLGGVEDVVRLLERLAEHRAEWATRTAEVAVNQHALLSDQRTAALVRPDGTVCWMCVPRLDGPAVFASLLGGEEAGEFSVRPAGWPGETGGKGCVQEYVGASMVLRTRWGGREVIDYLDCSGGRPRQRAGRSDLVRVLSGRGRFVVRFAPRLDFGRTATRLAVRPWGLTVEGCAEPLCLVAAGVEWQIQRQGGHDTAVAEVEVSGAPVVLEMRCGSAGGEAMTVEREAHRRRATEAFWTQWAAGVRLPSTASGAVLRSALMLHALTYGPTGAMAAAATTSLPEQLGGVRNWDYRFCWPRDAALAAQALLRLGVAEPAARLTDWLSGVLGATRGLGGAGAVRPLYAIDGRDTASEAQIDGLRGYAGSRPVRVGNAAALQVQLDVFGPIVDLVASLAEEGGPVGPDHWRMVTGMVGEIARRWREPDHGIWEIRLPGRRHVHTAAMCYHAVRRAMDLHRLVEGPAPRAWEQLAEEIAQEVRGMGFSERLGAYSAAFGHDAADASALAVGLTGLVDAGDPRFAATVECVLERLAEGPGVRRTEAEDGLSGREGVFHLCTGWLIESLLLLGRREEACEWFAKLQACQGPTGLMSEQHDPVHGVALGNVPQGYTHLALINSALALDGARAAAVRRGDAA